MRPEAGVAWEKFQYAISLLAVSHGPSQERLPEAYKALTEGEMAIDVETLPEGVREAYVAWLEGYAGIEDLSNSVASVFCHRLWFVYQDFRLMMEAHTND